MIPHKMHKAKVGLKEEIQGEQDKHNEKLDPVVAATHKGFDDRLKDAEAQKTLKSE